METNFLPNPQMQLITSVTDLEHDIPKERAVGKYLNDDSISGNLHHFSLAIVSMPLPEVFVPWLIE